MTSDPTRTVAPREDRSVDDIRRENEHLRGHCIALAGHLRWAAKVIRAFGRTAQLEAIEGAIERWEQMP